ncbi:Hypp7505 [Branchiostoma lanceolatum]|uniref:Hypp7505 protein n=1 Tax=Branchiostoma lanceolatum TaxID=7740 RepID=A0A8K0EE23_BRALA|nr:Hypp7505 [Branchiostoma lanceolatum]
MSVDLTSVLKPHEYVCKQSDAAKSEGKFRRFRIYDIKLTKREGIRLLKMLKERTLTQKDQADEIRQMVQRYIGRLREEAADKFGPNSAPIEKFEEMAESMLQNDPAAEFSLMGSKWVTQAQHKEGRKRALWEELLEGWLIRTRGMKQPLFCHSTGRRASLRASKATYTCVMVIFVLHWKLYAQDVTLILT